MNHSRRCRQPKATLTTLILFRRQEYELGKQDEATLPTIITEKIKPLVDIPFKSAAEIQGGRDFLIRTQQQDGSRITASKTISNTSDPERLQARDEIYHYWGTAWATLGLLESLRSDTAGR